MKAQHCYLKISKSKWRLLLNVEDYRIFSPHVFPLKMAKCEQKFLVNPHFLLNSAESFEVDTHFALKYDKSFWVNAHFPLDL